jgi:hypothetical protein
VQEALLAEHPPIGHAPTTHAHLRAALNRGDERYVRRLAALAMIGVFVRMTSA